jgi:proteic killer suppression protein
MRRIRLVIRGRHRPAALPELLRRGAEDHRGARRQLSWPVRIIVAGHQLQISKPTLSVPVPSPRSALPERSPGPRPRKAFCSTESLWRIKIAHDSLGRVRRYRALFQSRARSRFRNIERVARCKLLQSHAATGLASLRVPPGNKLDVLKADRKGQHSIRINDQWRICFVWKIIATVAVILFGVLVGHLLGGPDPGNRGALAGATVFRHPAIAIVLASGAFPERESTVLGAVLMHRVASLLLSVPHERWRESVTFEQPHVGKLR